MKQLCLSLLIAFAITGGGRPSASQPLVAGKNDRLQIVPAQVPAGCNRRIGQKQILFDMCRDQSSLLKEARKKARMSEKVVLVSFGADWCIWCQVFEAHILGGYGTLTYDTPDGPWTMEEKGHADGREAQAAALKAYVQEKFVVVNIAQESGESASAVLRETAADAHYSGGLPFIYALDRNGRLAGAIKSSEVEVRRDGDDPYRGYDRVKLLAALRLLSMSGSSN